jgi:hypothetical protein
VRQFIEGPPRAATRVQGARAVGEFYAVELGAQDTPAATVPPVSFVVGEQRVKFCIDHALSIRPGALAGAWPMLGSDFDAAAGGPESPRRR